MRRIAGDLSFSIAEGNEPSKVRACVIGSVILTVSAAAECMNEEYALVEDAIALELVEVGGHY